MWNEQQFKKQIENIPKENLLKFYLDFQYLIQQAQQEDYENYNIER